MQRLFHAFDINCLVIKGSKLYFFNNAAFFIFLHCLELQTFHGMLFRKFLFSSFQDFNCCLFLSSQKASSNCNCYKKQRGTDNNNNNKYGFVQSKYFVRFVIFLSIYKVKK